MIALLSPAKSLDFKSPVPTEEFSQPAFLKEAESLINKLKKKKPSDLKEMMDISDALAELNVQRFSEWTIDHTSANARQAIFAFDGDVYDGLAARTFDEKTIRSANDRIRILSGLYGILRPLDAIMPYRLEMGSAFAPSAKQKNLSQFWQEKVTKELLATNTDLIVNLASAEYFKAVDLKKLTMPVVTCHFKEERNGQVKIVQFYTKKARGLMAAFIARHQIEKASDLRAFDSDGYLYQASLSTEKDLVFTRPQP
jgi:uncharacterized protein